MQHGYACVVSWRTHSPYECVGEEASILMDRPPGSWSDLVTNQTLDLKMDALRSDLRAEMSALSASVDRRPRAQTWMMMSTMIAAVGLSVTLSRI